MARYRSRAAFPLITPTNEPGTCLTCGGKLRYYSSYSHDYMHISAATEEQRKKWPLAHYYDRDKNGDEVYIGSYYQEACFVRTGITGTGMTEYAGGPRQGDNLFCKPACAVGFARIVAHMGFRLPSLTPEQQKEQKQYLEMLEQLTPDVLLPPALPRMKDQNEPREGKPSGRSHKRTVSTWTRPPSEYMRYTGPRCPRPKKRKERGAFDEE